ncbi:hypothetical protein ACRYI5_03335 [Furfurilactobacillus sp. WILCCON 0119]|uniref:hypothetical protein n=1 Tax=Furfurilactobacillus entadae TaxID=2922307 RepID=UPI0038B3DB2C
MKKEEIDTMSFNKFIRLLVSLFLVWWLAGFVLSVGWNWFITPLFKLPSLNVPIATGLYTLINFVLPTNQESEDKSSLELIVGSVTMCLAALIMFWVCHQVI